MTEGEIDKLYMAATESVGAATADSFAIYIKPYFERAKIAARAGNQWLALSTLAKVDDEIAAALDMRWRL